MKRFISVFLCLTIFFAVSVQAASETSAASSAVTETENQESAADHDREMAHLTAGGAFLTELDGRIWGIDSSGVFAMENGSETARFPGPFASICSFNGDLLLISTERTSDDSTEKASPSLVRLDPSDGTITRLYEFSPSTDAPYFLTIARDTLWIHYRGALLSFSPDGNVRPTPYQNVSYITEKGMYLPEAMEDSSSLGLLYVSLEDPARAFSYPELSEVYVNPCFSIDGRLYLMAGNKPAYVELDSDDTTVHYFPVDLSFPEENIIMTNANYWRFPGGTLLLFSVNTQPSDSSAGMFRHHLLQYMPSTGALLELTSVDSNFPLSWPIVAGDTLYMSDMIHTRPAVDLVPRKPLISGTFDPETP